jgi:hypothetical protein
MVCLLEAKIIVTPRLEACARTTYCTLSVGGSSVAQLHVVSENMSRENQKLSNQKGGLHGRRK